MSIMSDIFSKNMKQPKVIEVSNSDKRLHGNDSWIDYQTGIIYTKKSQSKIQKVAGVAHEKCHIACRSIKRNSHIQFNKSVTKELQTFPLYKEMKRNDYNKERLPEETFCETYAVVKSGIISKKRYDNMQNKYPKTYNAFNKTMKRLNLRL